MLAATAATGPADAESAAWYGRATIILNPVIYVKGSGQSAMGTSETLIGSGRKLTRRGFLASVAERPKTKIRN